MCQGPNSLLFRGHSSPYRTIYSKLLGRLFLLYRHEPLQTRIINTSERGPTPLPFLSGTKDEVLHKFKGNTPVLKTIHVMSFVLT